MTKMRQETEEIPVAVARLLETAPETIAPIAKAFRAFDPQVVVTIARGSSDHAAYFLKYAIELVLGLPVASQGPSIASIYGASMKMSGAATIAISQSGASSDIVAMAETARKGGALTAALVNTLPSPLSRLANMHWISGQARNMPLPPPNPMSIRLWQVSPSSPIGLKTTP